MQEIENQPPPFLGTWSRMYMVVIIYLAALITALALVSSFFQS